MLFYVEHTDKAGQVSRHFVEAGHAFDAWRAAIDTLGECARMVCKRVAGMSARDRARHGLPADVPMHGGASCN